jgi:hypothetical protein
MGRTLRSKKELPAPDYSSWRHKKHEKEKEKAQVRRVTRGAISQSQVAMENGPPAPPQAQRTPEIIRRKQRVPALKTSSQPVEILHYKTQELNEALTCFVNYVKTQGLWNQVTLVVSSEFGRTLSQNSNQGTDHGWGGHNFVASGDLMGGKIYGQYPKALRETESDLILPGGRMIPTTSLETMWAPVYEWLGVAAADIHDVLPNWQNAGADAPLLTKAELYDHSTSSISRETVDYGAKHFLRVKGSLNWLYDVGVGSPGSITRVSDPGSSSTELDHLWIVRSIEGSGLRTAADPKAGDCVKYGDTIYLQSNKQDYQWLNGGRGIGSIQVLTNDIRGEPGERSRYEWIVSSNLNHTIEDALAGGVTTDPMASSCVSMHDGFYLRTIIPEAQNLGRWLAGGGTNTQVPQIRGTRHFTYSTNVQTYDLDEGPLALSYFYWSFEAHELG